jgi:hypothetical protein
LASNTVSDWRINSIYCSWCNSWLKGTLQWFSQGRWLRSHLWDAEGGWRSGWKRNSSKDCPDLHPGHMFSFIVN